MNIAKNWWLVRTLAGVLAVCTLAGCAAANQAEQAGDSASAATASSENDTLAQPEDFLPQNLVTGERPPLVDLEDAAGNTISLADQYSGQPVWLVFFASWCPDCDEQLDSAAQMQQIADAAGVRLVFIDRLNPEKESVDAAEEKLSQKGVTWTSLPSGETGTADLLIDRSEALYKAWGIQEIPTSVFLDENGLVTAMKNNTMTAGECEGFVKKGLEGGTALVNTFLRARLLAESDGETAVRTGTEDTSDTPSGSDILSESQGLLMQYEVMSGDLETFDSVWSFVKNRMLVNGLPAWYVTADGEPADADAFLDDIRIWDALDQAGEDYQEDADALLESFAEGCLSDDGAVSYVSLSRKKSLSKAKRADSISLCYLDLTILEKLAKKDDRFQEAYQKAEEVLEGGYLGDTFPLYASVYHYSDESYGDEDLNTSEALYTLWNL
ncbi:MAG: redoxin domain-containing protein, partial [Lachnospiraceae bacterium]